MNLGLAGFSGCASWSLSNKETDFYSSLLSQKVSCTNNYQYKLESNTVTKLSFKTNNKRLGLKVCLLVSLKHWEVTQNTVAHNTDFGIATFLFVAFCLTA